MKLSPLPRSRPLRLIFSAIAFLAATVMIIYACKKQEEKAPDTLPPEGNAAVEQRFFRGAAKADPTLAAIAQSIAAQNNRFHFLTPAFARRTGYPKWEAALQGANRTAVTGAAGDNSGGTEVKYAYIPFAKDGENRVSSALAVRISGSDTAYRLLYASGYRRFGFESAGGDHWRGKDVFHLFLTLEQRAFGHRSFTILDGRVLGYRAEQRLQAEVEPSPVSSVWVDICHKVRVCVLVGELNARGDDGGSTSSSAGDNMPAVMW